MRARARLRLTSSLASASFLAASLLACGPRDPDTPPASGPVQRTEKNRFGLITCSDQTDATTCYTGRSIAGVSMGALGAGQLAFKNPELFDGVAMLGIFLVDWVYALHRFHDSYVGGFCDRDTILANMADVTNPDGRAFCGPVKGTEKIEPSGKLIEADQDYNHWYRWIDEGRGGSFGRSKLRESMSDISLAFGNAFYYNPASPYFPPGVPATERMRSEADRCAQPYVVKGLKHKEFNPDGTYDVIAFCDTNTNRGEFDPMRPAEVPAEVLLAVDYNGNGRRDAAEPVIVAARERYQDIGTKPNDAYDWEKNPHGTAGNKIWDEGEPYEDTGLDGVPGTGDYGEGNGKYDVSPNVQNYFDQNPRQLLANMPTGQLSRLNIWADAGIRDFLMSAVGTNWLWGELRARVGQQDSRDFTGFDSMLTDGSEDFDFLAVDYSKRSLGQNVYMRYGSPDASQRDINRGDGHHVGPPEQVVNRLLTSLSFLQSRFYEPDVLAAANPGDVSELIKPKTYHSAALDEDRKYGIVFPPGYDDPANADKRYPVVYFLHGQGMESEALLASGILFFAYMSGSNREDIMRRGQADWAKFILVFPDSVCRRGECTGGNFNSNHRGLDGNGPRYEDSLFELMAHVEQTYRTMIPVEVPRE